MMHSRRQQSINSRGLTDSVQYKIIESIEIEREREGKYHPMVLTAEFELRGKDYPFMLEKSDRLVKAIQAVMEEGSTK